MGGQIDVVSRYDGGNDQKEKEGQDHLGVLVVRYCWVVFIPNVQAHKSPFSLLPPFVEKVGASAV